MSTVKREPADPNLIDWLRTLLDGWQALVVCVIAGAVLGLVATFLQVPQYRATGTIVVTPRAFLDPNQASQLPTLTGTVQRLAGTTAVLIPAGRAYTALTRDAVTQAQRRATADPDWMFRHLEVVQQGESSIIEVSGTAGNQRDATDLTRATVQTLTNVINRLGSSRDSAAGGIRVKVFSAAEPVGQVSPTPVRNIAVGVAAGVILGALAALLLGISRRCLRRPTDVEATLDAPVIGEIRDTSGKLDFEPGLISARAFLQTLWSDRSGVALLTTGTVGTGELKRLSESLVRALAGPGNDAVLVEPDSLTLAVSQEQGVGVSAEQPELAAAAQGSRRARASTTAGSRPRASAALPANDPTEASGNGRLRRNIMSLRQTNSYVVVAGPQLHNVAELSALAGLVDHAIVIVQRGVRARELRDAHGLDPKIVGAILIG